MNPPALPRRKVPKQERVRLYTRLSRPLREHLSAYSKTKGRSERAVIEEAVARYLANPAPSTSGPLDRLAQAIDEDRRLRERQHRDLEILSEAFGRFLRAWAFVHAPMSKQPPASSPSEAASRQQAAGESLYKRLAADVAAQFQRGHRFIHDLPGLDGSRSQREGQP